MSNFIPPESLPALERAGRRLPTSLMLVVAAWLAYLIALPIAWAHSAALTITLVPTLGVFLFTWIGYYRHELWHGYFPQIDNAAWFRFVSYLLFSDPQVYGAAHPNHHKHLHTPRDIEFFCDGWATDPARRRRQFALELVFGNAAWELACLWRLKREGRATARAGRRALGMRVALLAPVLAAAESCVPGGAWTCLAGYAATLWAGSIVTRHDQWIEHLGIVSDGPLDERNMLTRNLTTHTWSGWLFNVWNHNEPREHVLHHTDPKVNSRGFPGLALPPGARTITLGAYARLLAEHWRQLASDPAQWCREAEMPSGPRVI